MKKQTYLSDGGGTGRVKSSRTKKSYVWDDTVKDVYEPTDNPNVYRSVRNSKVKSSPRYSKYNEARQRSNFEEAYSRALKNRKK